MDQNDCSINTQYQIKPAIGVIGTGDFARAISKRLVMCGYEVYMGSRSPREHEVKDIDGIFEDIHIVSNDCCLTNRDIKIVFLAVPHHAFASILHHYADFLKEKILIDVSNRDKPCESESIAESLANMFPETQVVKAFNTLSAYAIESDTFGGSRRVLIASNDAETSLIVSELCNNIGFSSMNMGGLRNARKLENQSFMSGWRSPTVFVFCVFLFWFTVCAVEFALFFSSHPEIKTTYSHLPLGGLNKPICLTAITLLALVYLPGCFAAFIQIYHGTKYKRFPAWMDRWMKSRKMLGLYALLFSCWHVLVSAIFLSPASMPEWYQEHTIHLPANITGFSFHVSAPMNWIGETAITVGVMGLLCMIILGLTSIPSITEILNWQEWRFFQSRLGYVTLFLVTGHILIMSVPEWVRHPKTIIISNRFYCIILPVFVFLLKFILLIPCINNYVSKIRQGWENKVYQVRSNRYLRV